MTTLAPADQDLWNRLTDEEIDIARRDCEIHDGFATWEGMTQQGMVRLVWAAVEFWEPQGRGWSNRKMFETAEEPEFVEVIA